MSGLTRRLGLKFFPSTPDLRGFRGKKLAADDAESAYIKQLKVTDVYTRLSWEVVEFWPPGCFH